MNQEPSSQTPSGSDVFVSYASSDAAVANSIVENLEKSRVRCWIAPRDVRPGTVYADAIVGAINGAKSLVLVLSASAMASAHVGREVERAASKRRPIIAFRMDDAPLSQELEYFLSNSQWIDAKALGMPAALAKLKEAVGQGSTTSTQDVTASKPPGRAKKRIAIAATAVVVALGMTVGLGFYFWSSKHGAGTTEVVAIDDKSIAVLPFVDMSEKKDQEYFGDGMAEEIIDLLVKIPGLKVIGRTSSFQFKGKTEDLRTIGTQLGVAYVLEGSIRKSGDHLRVTAQLINTRDGAHVFSRTYERDLTDVLKIQDEIAAQVVRALQFEVGADGLVSHPTLRNAEAYTLYLRAQHARDQFDRQGFEQAVNDFQRVLELDPSFIQAAGALADMYQFAGINGYLPPAVAFEKTQHAAELALKLDPSFAEAHAYLGFIYGAYQWDWTRAEQETKLALALARNDVEVLWAATLHSMTLGRWDDALKFANVWVELDPLDPSAYRWLSLVESRRGRLAEAEVAIRRTLQVSPTLTNGQYELGLVLLARNQPEAALAEMLKETDDAPRLRGSAMAFFALGAKSDSDAALAQALKSYVRSPSGFAAVYAFRGESDEAFKWLDRAYAEKEPRLFRIKFATEFDSLRGDPRYKAFLKKMNLPE